MADGTAQIPGIGEACVAATIRVAGPRLRRSDAEPSGLTEVVIVSRGGHPPRSGAIRARRRDPDIAARPSTLLPRCGAPRVAARHAPP
jgi:hypothetical protein